MQLTVDFLVGGSNPGRVKMPGPPAPPQRGASQDSNHRPCLLLPAALPFDQQLCVSVTLPHCLEPSRRKLLTPPHPPPPQKSDIQFWGVAYKRVNRVRIGSDSNVARAQIKGAPQAQCARSATIWASGRTRDPYFEILRAPRGIMVTPSRGFDF